MSWPDDAKTAEIEKLKQEKEQLAGETEARVAAAKEEIVQSEKARYSTGSAQVYAADATLEASPSPDKYNLAASKALDVAREALPVPQTSDLIAANKIQADLLSEQAERIAAAETALGAAKVEIVAAKNKEEELKTAQEKWRAESAAKEKELADQIAAKQAALDKERLEWAGKAEQDAAKYRYDQVWYRRLNPLTHIGKLFSSLGVWLIVFVVIGGGLKIASLFFPGSGIIGSIVGGAGKAIGGVIRLFAGYIPSMLEGAGAVDKKDYDQERTLANNAIGATQEFKDENPELFEEKMKNKLEDWFADHPELVKVVDRRLKELNLR